MHAFSTANPTMKIAAALTLLFASASAFAPPSATNNVRSSTSLSMSSADQQLDRRTFAFSVAFTTTPAAAAAAAAATFVASPIQPAQAAGYFEEYTPKYDDVKQIYVLGVTLDRLVEKIADPEKYDGGRAMFDKALEGLRQWNKDPNFYNGYAKNYVSKLVKRGSADDPRVAYVKEASANISSCQELLEGRVEGFAGKAAGDEAIKRIKEAQKLIAKFLVEAGIEGEGADKIASYAKSH